MSVRTRMFYMRLLIVFITLIAFSIQVVCAAETRKNVLILNSYNYGNPFSDDETHGVLEGLNNSGLNMSISVEYMDWKKYPYNERLKLLYEDYKIKYASKLDLVLAQDDEALKFALKYRKEIFNDASIVFCGINEVSQRTLLTNQSRITGVIEDCDPEGTIAAILKINPDTKKLYIIYDNTETGLATAEMTVEAIQKINKNLEFYPLNNLTNEALYEKVRHLPQDSAVIYTAYYTDNSGNTDTSNEICQNVSKNSSVPVYHLYDFALGHGIIGGSLLTGQRHGLTAGEMAVKVLRGMPIDSIPISNEKTTQLIFDYKEMQRFNISMDSLPENSEVINKPFSFYDTYKNLVYMVLGSFVVLFVFIGLLLTNIRRRRVAEKVLRNANDELNLLYEEIAASEEELRSNYHELTEKQAALIQSEERYALATDGSNDVIWDYDIQNKNIYMSERVYELLGYINEQMNNVNKFVLLVHPKDKPLLACDKICSYAQKNPFFTKEVRVKCQNGEYKWTLIRGKILFDSKGKAIRMAGSLTDIAERKSNEQAMHYMAYHDMLTGLVNRSALSNEFSALNFKNTAAIMFLDLDNFKNVNDSMGHSYGDKVLIEVGRRLKSSADKNIVVARMGGDEFVVLRNNIEREQELYTYAKDIMQAIQAPLHIDGNLVKLGASMGIACYPKDGTNFDEICRNADTAMYDAKSKGRKQFSFFQKVMNERLANKIKVEADLLEALNKNEFILEYQPQLDIASSNICGLEALVRWVKPGVGMVYPGEFIDLCEETGLIIPLGKLVLEKALRFSAELKAMDIVMCIGINVSGIQFNQNDFVPMVLAAIEKAGVSGENIGIEITETVFMDNFGENVVKINQLRSKGIQIFLDDFGTGYSSLKYLKNLPIDKLKVDKTFIDDIAKHEDNITETIIAMAHKMGMKVVAEGVEQREQLELLQEYECDIIQGYYISKPVSKESILQMIKSH